MEWWERVVVSPIRRFWIGLATRLRLRKTGLWKLRKVVRECDYEDVQVMWEMLQTDSVNGRFSPSPRQRTMADNFWWRMSIFRWAPHNLCRSF